MNIYKNMAVK